MLVTYPDVRNLSGCSLATRIFVTYPHAHYLYACVLTPGSCPPTGAATSPNISPLCSTSCAAASNRAAGQNSPRSACSQPKRDKTLPAQLARSQNGTKLSLHAPNGPKCAYFGEQGEFCHASTPNRPRRANFVTENAPQRQCRTSSVTPSAARPHVNLCVRT